MGDTDETADPIEGLLDEYFRDKLESEVRLAALRKKVLDAIRADDMDTIAELWATGEIDVSERAIVHGRCESQQDAKQQARKVAEGLTRSERYE